MRVRWALPWMSWPPIVTRLDPDAEDVEPAPTAGPATRVREATADLADLAGEDAGEAVRRSTTRPRDQVDSAAARLPASGVVAEAERHRRRPDRARPRLPAGLREGAGGAGDHHDHLGRPAPGPPGGGRSGAWPAPPKRRQHPALAPRPAVASRPGVGRPDRPGRHRRATRPARPRERPPAATARPRPAPHPKATEVIGRKVNRPRREPRRRTSPALEFCRPPSPEQPPRSQEPGPLRRWWTSLTGPRPRIRPPRPRTTSTSSRPPCGGRNRSTATSSPSS